jgi:oligoribonuclease
MSTNSQINSTPEKNFSNKTMSANNLPDWSRLVWVDCEMTGLDTKVDTLLEVAVLVTDGDLNIVADGPNIVIHHPEQVLTSMNEWCIQHHGKSGLTQMVRDSKIR